MSRSLSALVVGLFAVTVFAVADDKKPGEVKSLKGTLVCGKCKLGETAKCSHVLLVKEKGKTEEVKYYLNDKGAKEPFHGKVCQADVEGVKVKGKVVEKEEGGKKKLTVNEPKVEFPK